MRAFEKNSAGLIEMKTRRFSESRRPSKLFTLLFLIMAMITGAFPEWRTDATAAAITQQTEVKTEMAAAVFPRFVSDYINDLHSRHPLLAALSGIHAWDGQLEDYSAAALASEIAALKEFQLRLEKIPPLSLSFSDMFDYEIISSNIKARLLELEQIKEYARNPKIYADTISNQLLFAMVCEYAPLDSRLRHIIAKEKQVPRLLESARMNLKNPPFILLKISLDTFKGVLSFMQIDLPKAFIPVRDPKLQAEFKKATEAAVTAVRDFINYLEHVKPDPDATFAIGKQYLDAWLKYSEGIDVSSDTLLKISNRELSEKQEEFRKVALIIDPHKNQLAIWAKVQADHPKGGTLVSEASGQLQVLRRFIEENHLVPLPEDDPPYVAPAPDFMRSSTASVWTPGPFDQAKIRACYFIADVDPKWNDSQKEEFLSTFNYSQLWATSIHEAYPGHYVQAMYLRHVNSVVRRTRAFASKSLVEGWAHYAEQIMVDEGFGGRDPRIKLGQLSGALLRLCRSVVAIRMHTQGMTVDQATRFFKYNAYLGQTASRLEAERGTYDYGYLTYSLGKMAILKLKNDYKRYRNEDFSLYEFHDRILSNGLAPLWAQRQMIMPGDKGKIIE